MSDLNVEAWQNLLDFYKKCRAECNLAIEDYPELPDAIAVCVHGYRTLLAVRIDEVQERLEMAKEMSDA